MEDRFMDSAGGPMFMTEPGVWVQFDGYDIIDGEVHLYFEGQNVAVLKGIDSTDFRTYVTEHDDGLMGDEL